jgi:hypothetical protein
MKKNSRKIMMASASALAVVALAGITGYSAKNVVVAATGTTYSEDFNSTTNKVSGLGTSPIF